MSDQKLFEIIKEKNKNNGFNINWDNFEKNINWDQVKKSFTENKFEIIMENNDVYFGVVEFSFDNKILKEAKPE